MASCDEWAAFVEVCLAPSIEGKFSTNALSKYHKVRVAVDNADGMIRHDELKRQLLQNNEVAEAFGADVEAKHLLLLDGQRAKITAEVRLDLVGSKIQNFMCCEQEWSCDDLTKLRNVDQRRLNAWLADNPKENDASAASQGSSFKLGPNTTVYHVQSDVSTTVSPSELPTIAAFDAPSRPMRVGRGQLDKEYCAPERGAPAIADPLKELMDNPITAHLGDCYDPSTAYPKMNQWATVRTVDADLPQQPVDVGAETARVLDEEWAYHHSDIAKWENQESTLPITVNLQETTEGLYTNVVFNPNGQHTIIIGPHHPRFQAAQATQTDRLERTEIKRKIEVNIICPVDGAHNGFLVIYDNGPGMKAAELNEGLMNLDGSRTSRGYLDKLPDVDHTIKKMSHSKAQSKDQPTHGLVGRISKYGLGAKTASFQIGDQENRGFMYRTKTAKETQVSEVEFSEQNIRKKVEAGHDWTEAPSYKVNQPCGDSSCSFLEDTTSGCFDVREHEVIKKYIATEKENESFTLMIVYGVKAEYLTELQQPGTSAAAARIIGTDKRGCQRLAEELAHCYHFYLHGFFGKCGEGMSDWAPKHPNEGSAGALKPNACALGVANNGWKCRMTLSFHEPEKVTIWDLAKMIDPINGAECDPRAAVLACSATKRFRMRVKIEGYKAGVNKELGETPIVMDIMLNYLTIQDTGKGIGESWEDLYEQLGVGEEDDEGEGRPLRPHQLSTYWEGRGILPSGFTPALLLSNKSRNDQSLCRLKGIDEDMLRRVRGVIFVTRPMRANETKQSISDAVNEMLNAALKIDASTSQTIKDGLTGFDATSEITCTFPQEKQRQSLALALKSWITECAKQDKNIIAEFRSTGTKLTWFPNSKMWDLIAEGDKALDHAVPLGVLENLQLELVAKNEKHKLVSTELRLTVPSPSDSTPVPVEHVKGKSKVNRMVLKEKANDREFTVGASAAKLLVIEKGAIVAFKEPLSKNEFCLHIGKVVRIKTTYRCPHCANGTVGTNFDRKHELSNHILQKHPAKNSDQKADSEIATTEVIQANEFEIFVNVFYPCEEKSPGSDSGKFVLSTPSGVKAVEHINIFAVTTEDVEEEIEWQKLMRWSYEHRPVLHLSVHLAAADNKRDFDLVGKTIEDANSHIRRQTRSNLTPFDMRLPAGTMLPELTVTTVCAAACKENLVQYNTLKERKEKIPSWEGKDIGLVFSQSEGGKKATPTTTNEVSGAWGNYKFKHRFINVWLVSEVTQQVEMDTDGTTPKRNVYSFKAEAYVKTPKGKEPSDVLSFELLVTLECGPPKMVIFPEDSTVVVGQKLPTLSFKVADHVGNGIPSESIRVQRLAVDESQANMVSIDESAVTPEAVGAKWPGWFIVNDLGLSMKAVPAVPQAAPPNMIKFVATVMLDNGVGANTPFTLKFDQTTKGTVGSEIEMDYQGSEAAWGVSRTSGEVHEVRACLEPPQPAVINGEDAWFLVFLVDASGCWPPDEGETCEVTTVVNGIRTTFPFDETAKARVMCKALSAQTWEEGCLVTFEVRRTTDRDTLLKKVEVPVTLQPSPTRIVGMTLHNERATAVQDGTNVTVSAGEQVELHITIKFENGKTVTNQMPDGVDLLGDILNGWLPGNALLTPEGLIKAGTHEHSLTLKQPGWPNIVHLLKINVVPGEPIKWQMTTPAGTEAFPCGEPFDVELWLKDKNGNKIGPDTLEGAEFPVLPTGLSTAAKTIAIREVAKLASAGNHWLFGSCRLLGAIPSGKAKVKVKLSTVPGAGHSLPCEPLVISMTAGPIHRLQLKGGGNGSPLISSSTSASDDQLPNAPTIVVHPRQEARSFESLQAVDRCNNVCQAQSRSIVTIDCGDSLMWTAQNGTLKKPMKLDDKGKLKLNGTHKFGIALKGKGRSSKKREDETVRVTMSAQAKKETFTFVVACEEYSYVESIELASQSVPEKRAGSRFLEEGDMVSMQIMFSSGPDASRRDAVARAIKFCLDDVECEFSTSEWKNMKRANTETRTQWQLEARFSSEDVEHLNSIGTFDDGVPAQCKISAMLDVNSTSAANHGTGQGRICSNKVDSTALPADAISLGIVSFDDFGEETWHGPVLGVTGSDVAVGMTPDGGLQLQVALADRFGNRCAKGASNEIVYIKAVPTSPKFPQMQLQQLDSDQGQPRDNAKRELTFQVNLYTTFQLLLFRHALFDSANENDTFCFSMRSENGTKLDCEFQLNNDLVMRLNKQLDQLEKLITKGLEGNGPLPEFEGTWATFVTNLPATFTFDGDEPREILDHVDECIATCETISEEKNTELKKVLGAAKFQPHLDAIKARVGTDAGDTHLGSLKDLLWFRPTAGGRDDHQFRQVQEAILRGRVGRHIKCWGGCDIATCKGTLVYNQAGDCPDGKLCGVLCLEDKDDKRYDVPAHLKALFGWTKDLNKSQKKRLGFVGHSALETWVACFEGAITTGEGDNIDELPSLKEVEALGMQIHGDEVILEGKEHVAPFLKAYTKKFEGCCRPNIVTLDGWCVDPAGCVFYNTPDAEEVGSLEFESVESPQNVWPDEVDPKALGVDEEDLDEDEIKTAIADTATSRDQFIEFKRNELLQKLIGECERLSEDAPKSSRTAVQAKKTPTKKPAAKKQKRGSGSPNKASAAKRKDPPDEGGGPAGKKAKMSEKKKGKQPLSRGKSK